MLPTLNYNIIIWFTKKLLVLSESNQHFRTSLSPPQQLDLCSFNWQISPTNLGLSKLY